MRKGQLVQLSYPTDWEMYYPKIMGAETLAPEDYIINRGLNDSGETHLPTRVLYHYVDDGDIFTVVKARTTYQTNDCHTERGQTLVLDTKCGKELYLETSLLGVVQ